MESGWIGLLELRRLYRVSKQVQSLFSCFNISKDFDGTLHIPSLAIWEDIFYALSYWGNFRRRNTVVPAMAAGNFLLVLLMYVDRTETALYIIRSLNVHGRHWIYPMQINGRRSVYDELSDLLPEHEKGVFFANVTRFNTVFYVSSELYQWSKLELEHGWGLDVWVVANLLRESVRSKSLVALQYCIELMKTNRKKTIGSVEYASCADAMKRLNWCGEGDSFLVDARDWTNPNAIKLAHWLRNLTVVPYLEFYGSLQSEAELRASFNRETGRWSPI
jgi:hypothetical protein